MTATSSLLPPVVAVAAAVSVLAGSADVAAAGLDALAFDSIDDLAGGVEGSWLQPTKANATTTGNKNVLKIFMDRHKCHNIGHLSSPLCLTVCRLTHTVDGIGYATTRWYAVR